MTGTRGIDGFVINYFFRAIVKLLQSKGSADHWQPEVHATVAFGFVGAIAMLFSPSKGMVEPTNTILLR